MSMKVILKDKKMFIAIGRAAIKHEIGLRRGLQEGGLIAKREVVRLIQEQPKTGAIYTIRGQSHQASAPGEAPASVTGNLAQKVSIKTVSATQLILGDKAKYGGYLEYGTRNMEPRPHLKTGAENTSRDMVNALLMNVKRELESP